MFRKTDNLYMMLTSNEYLCSEKKTFYLKMNIHGDHERTAMLQKWPIFKWTCMVSTSAFASYYINFNELYSENILELLWPQNIFSIARGKPVEDGVSKI